MAVWAFDHGAHAAVTHPAAAIATARVAAGALRLGLRVTVPNSEDGIAIPNALLASVSGRGPETGVLGLADYGSRA